MPPPALPLSRQWAGLLPELTEKIRDFARWEPTPSARAFRAAFEERTLWTGERVMVHYGWATRYNNFPLDMWRLLFPWEDFSDNEIKLSWWISVDHGDITWDIFPAQFDPARSLG